LLRYLTARFGDNEDARDLAQEAWLRIHRIRDPDTLTNARAFLYQTATNVGIDRARRRKLELAHAEETTLDEEPFASGVDDALANRETIELIGRCLAELPENCQRAFTLHRLHGHSYPEIAQQMGVSESMIEKYIIQALKAFRVRLAQAEKPVERNS
jgi:RNA polymerase sigma-70 factor (ECF subfamily)